MSVVSAGDVVSAGSAGSTGSTGSTGAAGPAHPGRRARRRAGHTRISSAALHHTIEAVAGDAFGIAAKDANARIEDDGGRLHVTVALALPLPSLAEAAHNPDVVAATGGTVYDRAEQARAAIISGALDIAGASVARVDVRLTGRQQDKKKGALR